MARPFGHIGETAYRAVFPLNPRVIVALCLVVLLAVWVGLVQPAITASYALTCGMEEHVHDDVCYDAYGNLTCGQVEHTHTAVCYSLKSDDDAAAGNSVAYDAETSEILGSSNAVATLASVDSESTEEDGVMLLSATNGLSGVNDLDGKTLYIGMQDATTSTPIYMTGEAVSTSGTDSSGQTLLPGLLGTADYSKAAAWTFTRVTEADEIAATCSWITTAGYDFAVYHVTNSSGQYLMLNGDGLTLNDGTGSYQGYGHKFGHYLICYTDGDGNFFIKGATGAQLRFLYCGTDVSADSSEVRFTCSPDSNRGVTSTDESGKQLVLYADSYTITNSGGDVATMKAVDIDDDSALNVIPYDMSFTQTGNKNWAFADVLAPKLTGYYFRYAAIDSNSNKGYGFGTTNSGTRFRLFKSSTFSTDGGGYWTRDTLTVNMYYQLYEATSTTGTIAYWVYVDGAWKQIATSDAAKLYSNVQTSTTDKTKRDTTNYYESTDDLDTAFADYGYATASSSSSVINAGTGATIGAAARITNVDDTDMDGTAEDDGYLVNVGSSTTDVNVYYLPAGNTASVTSTATTPATADQFFTVSAQVGNADAQSVLIQGGKTLSADQVEALGLTSDCDWWVSTDGGTTYTFVTDLAATLATSISSQTSFKTVGKQLNGQSFALANIQSGSTTANVLTTDDSTMKNTTHTIAASTKSVSSGSTDFYTADGYITFTDASLPEWTFEAVSGTLNTYYVSVTVDGTKKYLNVGDSQYSDTDLTLSTDPVPTLIQACTSPYEGCVKIGGALNYFGGSPASFGSWDHSDHSAELNNTQGSITLCKVTSGGAVYMNDGLTTSLQGTYELGSAYTVSLSNDRDWWLTTDGTTQLLDLGSASTVEYAIDTSASHVYTLSSVGKKLDGKDLAIVNKQAYGTNEGNVWALMNTASSYDSTHLASSKNEKGNFYLDVVSGDYFVADSTVTAWSFEAVPTVANAYYISCADADGDTKYLWIGVNTSGSNVSSAVKLVDEGERQAIPLTPGVGSGTSQDLTGRFKIGHALDSWGNDGQQFGSWEANDTTSVNEYYYLCDVTDAVRSVTISSTSSSSSSVTTYYPNNALVPSSKILLNEDLDWWLTVTDGTTTERKVLTSVEVAAYNTSGIVSTTLGGITTDGITANYTFTTSGLKLNGGSYVLANTNRTSGYADAINTTIQHRSDSGRDCDVLQTTHKQISTESETVDGYITFYDPRLTSWTFEAAANLPGYYCLSTKVDGETKYLSVDFSAADSRGNGDMVLSDLAVAQQVTACTGSYTGQVQIGNAIDFQNDENGKTVAGAWPSTSTTSAAESITLCKTVDATGALCYDINLPTTTTTEANRSWTTTPTLASRMVAISEGSLAAKPDGSYNRDASVAEADDNGYGFAARVWADKNPDSTEENPFDGLYRQTIVVNQGSSWMQYLTGEETDQFGVKYNTQRVYAEYRFDGWSYTDTDGVAHLFKAGTTFTAATGNSSATAVDTDGNTVTIPQASVLVGQWSVIDVPIYFFINKDGTILDTTAYLHHWDTTSFTKAMAFGRYFYDDSAPTPASGSGVTYNADGHYSVTADSGVYNVAVDNYVANLFTSYQDLTLDDASTAKKAQIYIMLAQIYDTSTKQMYFVTADGSVNFVGANSKTLANSTINEINNDPSTILQMNFGSKKSTVSSVSADLYSTNWYVVKDASDGWHIDGLMQAKSDQFTISKTFVGIEDFADTDSDGNVSLSELHAALPDYNILVWVDGDTAATYDAKCLIPYYDSNGSLVDNNETGIVEFEGWDEESQVATWTVHVLKGRQVTVQEFAYGGSSTASADSWTYTASDGSTVYQIADGETINANGSSIYSGAANDAVPLIGYDLAQSMKEAGYPESVYSSYNFTAGTDEDIAYANIYTKQGLGAVTLSKLKASDGKALEGAEFSIYRQLTNADGSLQYDDDGDPVLEDEATDVQVAQSQGTLCFNNLEKGTYYIKETGTPDGFRNYTSEIGKGMAHALKVSVEAVTDEDVSAGYATSTAYAKVTISDLVWNSGTNQYELYTDNNAVTLYGNGTTHYYGQGSYVITDEIDPGTIIIDKVFKGLTKAQVAALFQEDAVDETGTPTGFYIELKGTQSDGTTVSRILKRAESEGDAEGVTVYPSAASLTGLSFEWVISASVFDGIDNVQIIEHNIKSDDYANVVASGFFNYLTEEGLRDESGLVTGDLGFIQTYDKIRVFGSLCG